LAVVRDWTAQAGLTLHPVKPELVHACDDEFDFLGYHYHFERDRVWSRKNSMEKLKDTIRAKTKRTVGGGLILTAGEIDLQSFRPRRLDPGQGVRRASCCDCVA
jgi:RNA-directed DNA polymerase